MIEPADQSDRTAAEQLRALAPAASGGAGLAEAERAGIDVDKVIDTVRHHVGPIPSRPDTLEARDDDYHASFGPAGFDLSLGNDRLGVSLSAVTRGGRALDVEPSPWRGDANVARRSVARGLVEQVSARTGELEWDLVLTTPPPGRGALRVEADLSGARATTRLEDAWRFTLAGGAPVRMGEVVVKDATGAELYRSLPTVEGARLSLRCPSRYSTGRPTRSPSIPRWAPSAR